jgi:putative hydrolase of the HAD superfamily
MIRAVIFDCFGVLTNDGWKSIREEFFAHDDELMRTALDLDKAVNAGVMDYAKFVDEVARMSGLAKDEVLRRIDTTVPNTVLFHFIRDELKSKYKIGMLSNASSNMLNELFEPWQVELLDEAVLSYAIGTVKPDPVAYRTVAQRLGVQPAECLFIDDIDRYCDAAEHVGMKAILHTDSHQTVARIKELLSA